jgi:predicted phage tail protein
MVEIVLHGQLAEKMGRSVWRLFVHSVAEALRAIQANTGGKLYPYLSDRLNEDIGYAVHIDKVPFEEDYDLVIPRDTIRRIDIIPALIGSGGGGLGKILIGVALIVIAIVVVAASYFSATGVGLALVKLGVSLMVSAGISLLLGGISEMMAANPKIGPNSRVSRNFGNGDDSSKTGEGKKSSYLFAGIQNTTRQGNVVPLGYGRHRVGSQVISFSISPTKIDFSAQNQYVPTTGSIPFMASPGWVTLENSAYADQVGTVDNVRHSSTKKILEMATTFKLIGPDNPAGGHPRATTSQLRARLYTLAKLFNGPHDTITLTGLYGLYVWLGLTTLIPAPPKKHKWEEYVTEIGKFYEPGIIW